MGSCYAKHGISNGFFLEKNKKKELLLILTPTWNRWYKRKKRLAPL
jgi:hypothetical protein